MKSLLFLLIVAISLSDAILFASPSVMSPSQPPMEMSPSQPPMEMSLSQPLSPTSERSNSDCSTVIYSMVDCLSFLMVGSIDLIPTKKCCGGIKSVLVYNPHCFCSGLESSREMGFEVDDTKALAMPKYCNVAIDPHCDVATPPALSPTSPPAKPPTTSPSSPKSPAITHSSPAVTSSSPSVTHSSPAVTASSPVVAASSPVATYPSPPISRSENLSASKLFLIVMIISYFVYMSD